MLTAPETVDLRPLRPEELRFAARAHAALLPHGLFPRLGVRFLTRYYETFLASPYAFTSVALVDDHPVGVLVGTLDNAAHYAWVLRRRGLQLATSALAAMLLRPAVLACFMRTRALRYLRGAARLARRRPVVAQSGNGRVSDGDARTAVLSHVCVVEAAQGLGVGKALVERFLTAARCAGAGEARLLTLAGRAGAGSFYARTGWTHCGEHRGPDGLVFSTYRRRLDG